MAWRKWYERKKKVERKILWCGLVILCCLGMKVQFVSAETNQWQEKVDEDVLKIMSENPQQKIPVYIFLKDYQEIELVEKLQQQGIDMELYKDTEKFNEIVVPSIAEEVIQKVGFEKAYEKDMSLAVVKEATGCNILSRFCEWNNLAAAPCLVSEAINENISTYKKEKAECIQELCVDFNKEFIRLCNIDKQDVIFSGEQVRTLIVEATAAEIEKYAQQACVTDINYYEEEVAIPCMNYTLPKIGADSVSGTKSMGYTGSGVKIGIIEAAAGEYNANNVHLKGKTNLSYFELPGSPSGIIGKHATMVTSIICGNEKNKYGGLVPDARVYQTPIYTMDQTYTAIEHMVSMGIDVICLSLVLPSQSGKYTVVDRMLDSLISKNDIICVIAAGNESSYVGSPGLALNIITVGNINTTSKVTGYYELAGSSNYEEASYLPNKPDIVAPGTVFLYNDSGEISCFSGTSCSSPIVTGVIAQMLQANPELKANPTLVKSKLLLSATDDDVSTTNNPSVGYFQREKSGVGMVNAKAAITVAKSSNYKTITYRNQPQVINSAYYTAGTKIRIVMVMSNEDEKNITSISNLDDADLVLVDSSGNIVAESTSGANNVEIIEYTIKSSGKHTIRVDNYGSVLNINAKPEICVSWYVE